MSVVFRLRNVMSLYVPKRKYVINSNYFSLLFQTHHEQTKAYTNPFILTYLQTNQTTSTSDRIWMEMRSAMSLCRLELVPICRARWATRNNWKIIINTYHTDIAKICVDEAGVSAATVNQRRIPITSHHLPFLTKMPDKNSPLSDRTNWNAYCLI